MLYWFKTPRAFTWFVQNEFNWLQNLPDYIPVIKILYFGILMIWIVKTVYEILKPDNLIFQKLP
jgi:hypothetical protein